jgi:invasion protein IalB
MSFKINIATASIIMIFSLTGMVAKAQTTKLEKYYDNWKVDCRDNTENKNCAMIYSLLNKKTKKIVFSWTIIPDSKTKKGNKAIVRTPYGILIPSGIMVAFPGGTPVKLNYRTCRRGGCISEITITDDWLKALRSQKNMTVSYKSNSGKDLQHKIELAKFNDAYEFYNAELAQ